MIGYWILAVLAAFIAVVAVRTIRFRPKPQPAVTKEEIAFDKDAAVDSLAQLVRCKTVSYNDHSLEDEGEFQKLISLLPTLYPNVFAACTFRQLPDRALLFRWPGKQAGDPAVMMAHYDVVPVNEEKWDKPPFAGIIEDGILWGRGTLDTKVTFNGILSAANSLIGQGYRPEKDIYFAFSGGEEINGQGAPNIVAYFAEHGIHPAIVVDEGGAVVENVFPGVKQPCGLIGIAEKGSVFMDLIAKGKGGHASAPPARQSAGVLARALCRLKSHPMPFTLTQPASELFNLMGRHSTFAYKLIFSNLWCFAPLLNLICKKGGGELDALVRTTCALTRLSASDAYNVLPSESRAGANLRVICGETVETVRQRVVETIKNSDVAVEVVDGSNPSPISPTNGEGWDRLVTAIRQTYPDALVSPYLMLACSDSRHYCKICENVYRFSGMPLSKAQRGMIHSANERIPLALLGDTVRFFARVLKQC